MAGPKTKHRQRIGVLRGERRQGIGVLPSDTVAAASVETFWQRSFRGGLTPARQFQLGSVFVIMSFKGKGSPKVYAAIKEECEALQLAVSRVDENVGSGLIVQEIVEGIHQAEFIICDLTYERPNVYYELGYAHGIGNHPENILLIAKHRTDLHFDVAPLRVQFYRSIADLHTIVSSHLKKMMERRAFRRVSPTQVEDRGFELLASAPGETEPPT